MRIHRLIVVLFASSVLWGCAIHPQTEDFSREILPSIIHKVRCEAREGIMAILPDKHHYLMETILTYRFFFKMTENDDATSKGTVKVPIMLGTFTMGWEAGAKKQRVTEQEIKFQDSFSELTNLRCDDNYLRRNFLYPATGSIGLHASFDNYYRMTVAKPGSLSTFNDHVEFQTTLNISGTPEVDLTPAKTIIDASATLGVKRTDNHQIELAFAAPRTPEQKIADQREALKDRAKVLQLLREERKLPLYVRIVTVDDSGKKDFPLNGEGGVKIQGIAPPPRIIAPLPKSLDQRKREAQRKADRDRSLRLEERILERLDE